MNRIDAYFAANNAVDHTVFFDEVTIPPRETVMIKHREDSEWSLFRGLSFLAEESVPDATGIVMAFVGSMPQYPCPDSMRGFSTKDFNADSKWKTSWEVCNTPLVMSLFVNNRTDKSIKFKARLEGKAIMHGQETRKARQ